MLWFRFQINLHLRRLRLLHFDQYSCKHLCLFSPGCGWIYKLITIRKPITIVFILNTNNWNFFTDLSNVLNKSDSDDSASEQGCKGFRRGLSDSNLVRKFSYGLFNYFQVHINVLKEKASAKFIILVL